MKVGEYYQEGRYDKISIKERLPYYRDRFKVYKKFFGDLHFKKILDAGCGDGGLIKFIQEQTGAKGYGVDISEKGVSLAKKMGVDAKVADLSKKIPYPNNTFDLIIANELIEHLNDPDQFLKESKRILKRRSSLLIGTPNLSFWLNRILFLLGIYPLFLEASTEKKVGLGFMKRIAYGGQLVGHIRVFNTPAIKELLEFHGFRVKIIQGDSVRFASGKFGILTLLYTLGDRFFSKFPSFSSNLIIVAEKK
jgi:SAM-dependent methyltransferase